MQNALPSPRILLGPGPSNVNPGVLEALGRSPIGYLDPELFSMLDTLRADLRVLFGTTNEFTIPLTGTGMAGMECCLSNLIEPGDNVVVGINGFFGGRIAEISRRLGATVTEVHAAWGNIIEPGQFYEAVRSLNSVKLVATVHAETSTGVRQPLEPVAEIAHDRGALFMVDAVTSLGGIPVNIDECDVDVCYSGTQKCVGAPPGLSPISVNDAALAVARNRKAPLGHWYYDWQLLRNYYDAPHTYHHTVPVNLLFALKEALSEIIEEGLEPRYRRHREVSQILINGLTELGIKPFAHPEYRLPTLTSVIVPDSVTDEAAVRKRLLYEFGLEIGGGLGDLKGKIWRIGTMGASATRRNVVLLLIALEHILS